MSLIYGNLSRRGKVKPKYFRLLQEELETYPSDGHHFFKSDSLQAGVFSIRLRKEPFPEERIIEDKKSGLILIADARLDYRSELIEQLDISDHKSKLFSDIELIMCAYKKWGKKCVNHLEGDFVFLLYNTLEKTVWGARDPIGFRPLFFIQHEEDIYFSTSLKGLLNLNITDHSLNERFWFNRLFKIECPPTATPHQNIYQIPIGHEIEFSKNGFSINRYFYWKRQVEKKTSKEYEEALKQLISESVKTRLYPDYEIGSQLSGGLDSSAVNAIAINQLSKINSQRKIWSVSSVADSKQNHKRDERRWVEVFKKYFPLVNIKYVTFDEHPVPSDQHIPLFSSIRLRRYASHPIERQFQDHLESHNCKTVLTGWRGDHFISRHSFYSLNEILLQGNLSFYLRNIGNVKQAKKLSSLKLLKGIVKSNSPQSAGVSNKKRFINDDFLKKYEKEIDAVARKEKKWKARGVEWDFGRFLPQNGRELLFYIEDLSYLNKKVTYYLHPLSDKRIISFALNLPAIEFEKGGMDRSLFRRSMKVILPNELRFRFNKGYFNYKETEQLKVVLKYILEEKKEWIELSSFNKVIKRNIVLEEIRSFINTDSPKVSSALILSINLLGYLIYFTQSDGN